MSNQYMYDSTLDGKWSRTNQRYQGTPTQYSRQTNAYQPGYVSNRTHYPRHDDQRTPSEHVPPYRRFAKDAPRTHPMETIELGIPESIRSAPRYQLGNILLLVDSDPHSPTFAFTRKFYKNHDQPLFVDVDGNGYFSVHHYLQMRMILFFSGRVPESEPHFQSNENLRSAARENFQKYKDACYLIRNVADLKKVMGEMKLREFNFDFWYQSQTLADALVEANVLKFTQNQDLMSMLLPSAQQKNKFGVLDVTENTLFMEVSGFDQCYFGSGYSLEFLEKTRHFYTDRPQLWRGWNNFGEALRLVRKLLSFQSFVHSRPQSAAVARKRSRSEIIVLEQQTTDSHRTREKSEQFREILGERSEEGN